MPHDISAKRLMETVRTLAAFPTRHSLSRGLWDACDWLAGQYRAIPGVDVELMRTLLPEGRRVPKPTEAVQVVATLPGRSDRRIIVGAHIDSLNLCAGPDFAPAPGANDDASGVAVGLEVARALAGGERNCTVCFVAFCGEEQGLLGARALAGRARDEGWRIEAMLNFDTVGCSANLREQVDCGQVRVFSAEGASRALARTAEWRVRQAMDGFRVKLVLRKDRFGRGGDHTPFHEAGFPAVRFVEVHEEYSRQHTPDDLPEAVDADYLVRVARTCAMVTDSLAAAGPAPESVAVGRLDGHKARVSWTGAPQAEVFWRDTRSAEWQGVVGADGGAATLDLTVDDHCFGVSAPGGVIAEAEG